MLCDSAINNNNGVRVTVTRAAMSWGDEILLSSYVWNSMSSRWSISLATMEADIWEPIINDCRSEFDQFYANVVGFLNTYYRKHTESETTLPSKTAHVSGGALNSTPTMFQPTMLGRSLGKETIIMLRYDTIQDAILTCARKPTWVGLIYRTKTTTKNCKTEKLKSKRDILEVTVKVLGNHVVSSWEEKESLQWEGFGEKGFKLRLMQSLLPLWISIMLLPPPIRIIKSHSQNTVPIIVGHFAVYCYWFRWATCVVAR